MRSLKPQFFCKLIEVGSTKPTSSGSDKVRQERPQKLPPEAVELVKWLLQQIKSLDEIDYTVTFDAVEKGNFDFLTIVIREFPDLILKVDRKNHSIFHVAVLNRQKEIFRTINIQQISSALKKFILQLKDDEENNILHLAGKMPSREQLQQEFFWFKEVERIVDPMDVEAENKDKKTPTDLFNKKMTDLKKEGEKWMKEIANSCMIVATLITTVAFAAAFTVPGGTKDDTGTPHFLRKVSFIIFVISDAIALASSSWSILTILSIYTTRYTDEDFVMLPRNLVVGLSTLFLSIAAVMVVFCATIFIVFKDGKIWVPTLASMIASLPVISFTKQHQQLFYGVARLTFEKSFLAKTGKHSLFDDDDNDEGKSWNLKEQKDAACRNFLLKCWDFIHYRCSNFLEECWNSTYSRFFD
ncbi:ankyrin repeat-containing protein NPR4-like [Pistacia vera]|uniref:ankyrin repeat-containing protein NPR4-like n=1 Tax=Pistacia vera TaxID=55513 RepID=UPI001263B466|nr:ankyrin repeat-containing protein NPR4-like [Pistacia vera]